MLQLGSDTVRLLSSSQVITSPTTVVKELVENALDAGATNIDIKLENYCLDKIEVRDNGRGMSRDEVAHAAQPHFTSKLCSFADLGSLHTYGFRGEGLSSIAAVADVSITTCTEHDEVAMTHFIDHLGKVVSTKPSPAIKGTSVTVINLFKNVPVRKQYYKNSKMTKDSFRKIESILLALGLANPTVRLTLKHNKCLVWQKPTGSDFRSNVGVVLGAQVMQHLVAVGSECSEPIVKITGFVPSVSADPPAVFRATPERVFLLVNSRPVSIKPVIQLLRKACVEVFPSQSGRYPIAVLCIDVPPSDVDVNLESDKSRVALHNLDTVLVLLKSALDNVYQHIGSSGGGQHVCGSDDHHVGDQHTPNTARQTSVHCMNGESADTHDESAEMECGEERLSLSNDCSLSLNGMAPHSPVIDNRPATATLPVATGSCGISRSVEQPNTFKQKEKEEEKTEDEREKGSDISLAAWSRGVVTSHGKRLEPVTILSKSSSSSSLSSSSFSSSSTSLEHTVTSYPVQSRLNFSTLQGQERRLACHSLPAGKRKATTKRPPQKGTIHSFATVREKQSPQQRPQQHIHQQAIHVGVAEATVPFDLDSLRGRCSTTHEQQATTCSDANYIIGSCHHKYDDSDDCADSDDSSSEEREDKCAWLACVGGSRIVLFRPDQLMDSAYGSQHDCVSSNQDTGTMCVLLHKYLKEHGLVGGTYHELAVLDTCTQRPCTFKH